ncbi:MAG: hypothetical protein M3Z66_00970 [Chloroflexota bacterium]|nr:hypothetical protein [Chloroflexota bacterium]
MVHDILSSGGTIQTGRRNSCSMGAQDLVAGGFAGGGAEEYFKEQTPPSSAPIAARKAQCA